jgi:hypothetical protein
MASPRQFALLLSEDLDFHPGDVGSVRSMNLSIMEAVIFQ